MKRMLPTGRSLSSPISMICKRNLRGALSAAPRIAAPMSSIAGSQPPHAKPRGPPPRGMRTGEERPASCTPGYPPLYQPLHPPGCDSCDSFPRSSIPTLSPAPSLSPTLVADHALSCQTCRSWVLSISSPSLSAPLTPETIRYMHRRNRTLPDGIPSLCLPTPCQNLVASRLLASLPGPPTYPGGSSETLNFNTRILSTDLLPTRAVGRAWEEAGPQGRCRAEAGRRRPLGQPFGVGRVSP